MNNVHNNRRVTLTPWILGLGLLLAPMKSEAQSPLLFGAKIRMGGRYDNVRMCVASPAGVNGGPAMDISGFLSVPMGEWGRLELDLPVVRPILFATAFSMLQFEPSATLKFRLSRSIKREIMVGPMLGASFHYGPDVDSESSGDKRGPSFYALGPMAGGYAGVNFLRPSGSFDLQVGVTLYATRLVSVNDDANHKGFVAGGSLDIGFRFH
ncbi:hypothetical protein KKF84_11840 [Myxococcota bacterium]|nr:hypothetical protein [Myxococcota bacterium]